MNDDLLLLQRPCIEPEWLILLFSLAKPSRVPSQPRTRPPAPSPTPSNHNPRSSIRSGITATPAAAAAPELEEGEGVYPTLSFKPTILSAVAVSAGQESVSGGSHRTEGAVAYCPPPLYHAFFPRRLQEFVALLAQLHTVLILDDHHEKGEAAIGSSNSAVKKCTAGKTVRHRKRSRMNENNIESDVMDSPPRKKFVRSADGIQQRHCSNETAEAHHHGSSLLFPRIQQQQQINFERYRLASVPLMTLLECTLQRRVLAFLNQEACHLVTSSCRRRLHNKRGIMHFAGIYAPYVKRRGDRVCDVLLKSLCLSCGVQLNSANRPEASGDMQGKHEPPSQSTITREWEPDPDRSTVQRLDDSHQDVSDQSNSRLAGSTHAPIADDRVDRIFSAHALAPSSAHVPTQQLHIGAVNAQDGTTNDANGLPNREHSVHYVASEVVAVTAAAHPMDELHLELEAIRGVLLASNENRRDHIHGNEFFGRVTKFRDKLLTLSQDKLNEALDSMLSTPKGPVTQGQAKGPSVEQHCLPVVKALFVRTTIMDTHNVMSYATAYTLCRRLLLPALLYPQSDVHDVLSTMTAVSFASHARALMLGTFAPWIIELARLDSNRQLPEYADTNDTLPYAESALCPSFLLQQGVNCSLFSAADFTALFGEIVRSPEASTGDIWASGDILDTLLLLLNCSLLLSSTDAEGQNISTHFIAMLSACPVAKSSVKFSRVLLVLFARFPGVVRQHSGSLRRLLGSVQTFLRRSLLAKLNTLLKKRK